MATAKSRPLTVAEYEALVNAGNENARLDPKIKQQMLMAEYLRKGNAPQGRQAGAVYVAPHWTELAGGLAREWAANKQSNDAIGRVNPDGTATGMAAQQLKKEQQQAILLRSLLGQQALGEQPVQPAAPVEGTGMDPTRRPGVFGEY
jgi:hypothetical protein